MNYSYIKNGHNIIFKDEKDYLRCKLLYLERSETNTANAPFCSFINFVESGGYRGASVGRIEVLDISHNGRQIQEMQGGIFGEFPEACGPVFGMVRDDGEV